MFKVPYSIIPTRTLKQVSKKLFYSFAGKMADNMPQLELFLRQAESGLIPKEYISMCMFSTTILFGFFLIFSFFMTKAGINFFLGVTISIFLCIIIFFQQALYPKTAANMRVRDIEKNLLPTLQNILIQLNSGVPVFNIIVSIANSNYGEISKEFEIAVREINAGKQQISVLDDLATRNPSINFRRAIWQITNGMKTGSDLSGILEESISSLGELQLIQIQRYGGQLKPFAMFYLLLAIILPSLGTTFIILLSSFLAISETGIKTIFWSLFIMVVILQIIFLGAIKSRRPTLLG